MAYGNSAKTLKSMSKLLSSDKQFSEPNFEILNSPNLAFPRVGPLPSSEAEMRGAVEGSSGGASSEEEIAPRVRGGFERVVLWS